MEQDSSGLPKIGSPNRFAFQQTFVRPITDAIAWRARQLTPKQLTYNLLASNGLGQAALDYRFNLDFAKNPLTAGFANNLSMGPSGTPLYGSTTSDSGVIKVVTESLSQGFSNLVKELRTIRQTVMALGRVSMASSVTGEKNTNKLSELVEVVKGVFQRRRFDDAESNLERGRNNQSAAEESVTTKAQTGILDTLFKGLGSFFKNKAALVGTAAFFLRDKIFDATKGIIVKMVDVFKSVRIGESAKKLIEPVIKSMKWIGEFFSDIAKYIVPVTETLGKTKSLTKLIPVVGQGIAVILAIFDGIAGFVKEFKNTDGTLLEKVKAGFGGAIQGIIKGILEIPKVIALGVKFITEKALSLFGMKEQAEKLKEFKLGDYIDNLIDGAFKIVIKSFKPEKNLIASVGKLVVETFKALLIHFVPGAKNFIHLIPGLSDDTQSKRLDDKAKEVDQIKSAIDIANSKAPAGLKPGETGDLTVFEQMSANARDAIDRGRQVVESVGKNVSANVRETLGNIGDNLKQGLEIPKKYFEAIRSAESGGRDNAKNPRSSASGRYQFTKGTWEGLGFDWSQRFDPLMQEKAIKAFTEQNAAALRKAGLPINGGTLYASHFLGTGAGKGLGAIDVYKKEDDIMLASFLPPGVINANPFLKNMNVGQFKLWAFKKGGGSLGNDANLATSAKSDAQAQQMHNQAINQAKINARRTTPIQQTNVSAPTTTVVNNNQRVGKSDRPSTQAERYRQWLSEGGPRP